MTPYVGTVIACYRAPSKLLNLLTLTHARHVTHSSAYSIEVAVEEKMLEVDSSEAIEEVIEETIVESNAIVNAIEEAIEEHRVDTQAIEEALART